MVVTKKKLEDAFEHNLKKLVQMYGPRIEIALSGGLDSVVLFHLCKKFQNTYHLELSAVHIHHGLSLQADAWLAFCQSLALEAQIAFRFERVNLNREAKSIEAEARDLRYQVFAKSSANILMMAHHLDDLAETVLLQTLRGSGIRALAALPAVRVLSPTCQIARPLLNSTRQSILAYAQSLDLIWVEDESNQDSQYRRNFIRNEWLPQLEDYLPDYRQHLARVASLAQDSLSIISEVAEQDFTRVQRGHGLSIDHLLALSVPRQKEVILYYLRLFGVNIRPETLTDLCEQLQDTHQAVKIQWTHWTLMRQKDSLLLSFLPSSPSLFDRLRSMQDLDTESGTLRWHVATQGLNPVMCSLLFWSQFKPGDKIYLNKQHKTVKNICQQYHIPAHLRSTWPILRNAAGDIVMVLNGPIHEDYRVSNGVSPSWYPKGYLNIPK